MSAFIIEDTTISGLVYFFAKGRNLESIRRRITEETGCDLATQDGRASLAQAMHKLNVDAVNQRYDEQTTADGFEYRANGRFSIYQAYKSLRCYLYQCSEGDVPETRTLYVCLSGISDALAHHIAYSLPQVDNANWG